MLEVRLARASAFRLYDLKTCATINFMNPSIMDRAGFIYPFVHFWPRILPTIERRLTTSQIEVLSA